MNASFAKLRMRPRWKYLSLAGMAFQRIVIFRRSLIITFAANLVWVAIFYFLWQAVFAAM